MTRIMKISVPMFVSLLMACQPSVESISVAEEVPVVEIRHVDMEIPIMCPAGTFPVHQPQNELSVRMLNPSEQDHLVVISPNMGIVGQVETPGMESFDFSISYVYGCDEMIPAGSENTLVCAGGSVNYSAVVDPCKLCTDDTKLFFTLPILTDSGEFVIGEGVVENPFTCVY